MSKMTFIKVLMTLALCVVGIGFYQGWFVLSSSSQDSSSKKVNISLTVDPDKVKEDAQLAKDKASDLANKATDGAKELGGKARAAVQPEKKSPDGK